MKKLIKKRRQMRRKQKFGPDDTKIGIEFYIIPGLAIMIVWILFIAKVIQ